MKQNEHGRILAVAAKRHLAPVGGRRKGQSRVWLIDHGSWLVQVEFQPSGWSKGSYLNVGAHWLWRVEPGPISFDYNDRVEDFISFESSEQFEPEADRLAARATKEVLKLESIFGSITAIAQVLTDLVVAGRTGSSSIMPPLQQAWQAKSQNPMLSSNGCRPTSLILLGRSPPDLIVFWNSLTSIRLLSNSA